jgi:hypothetical protein
MTGRQTGANTRPAITKIASSRRMVKFRFTKARFPQSGGNSKATGASYHVRPVLIGINADKSG